MQKIVILCGDQGANRAMVSTLQLIFPECEIEVQEKGTALINASIVMPSNTGSRRKEGDRPNKTPK